VMRSLPIQRSPPRGGWNAERNPRIAMIC